MIQVPVCAPVAPDSTAQYVWPWNQTFDCGLASGFLKSVIVGSTVQISCALTD
jgi:hypothetical protein